MNVKSIETNLPFNPVKINFPEGVKGQLDAVVNGSSAVEQLSGEKAKEIASQIPLVTPVKGVALAGPLEADTLEIGKVALKGTKEAPKSPLKEFRVPLNDVKIAAENKSIVENAGNKILNDMGIAVKKTEGTPIDVAEQAAKKMSKGKAAAVVVGILALIGAAFGIKKAVDNKNANKAANQA